MTVTTGTWEKQASNGYHEAIRHPCTTGRGKCYAVCFRWREERKKREMKRNEKKQTPTETYMGPTLWTNYTRRNSSTYKKKSKEERGQKRRLYWNIMGAVHLSRDSWYPPLFQYFNIWFSSCLFSAVIHRVNILFLKHSYTTEIQLSIATTWLGCSVSK